MVASQPGQAGPRQLLLMIHEPARRSRRCTRPILAISVLQDVLLLGPMARRPAGSSSSSEMPGTWLTWPKRSSPYSHFALATIVRTAAAVVQEHRLLDVRDDGALVGIGMPLCAAHARSSSLSRLAKYCALRRASLSGESSGRLPSRCH